MNKNLVQINNYCGVVSDEKGNISLIDKESDSVDFEEILSKENEIEDLQLSLKKDKKTLSNNRQNTIFGVTADLFLLGMEIFMYTVLHSIVAIEMLITLIAVSYIPFKGMLCLLYGTGIGRYIKKKKLTSKVEQKEQELSVLEEELTEIKERSKYRVNCSTAVDSNEKTSTEELDFEISMPRINNINSQINKVRVLSLSKKRKK